MVSKAAEGSRVAALTEMFRITPNVPSTPLKGLTGEVRERTIWGYWAQGHDHMPEFFKMCVDTWRNHNPGWDVRVLSRAALPDFLSEADLPNRFQHLFSPQTASDCVRLALLARYGGVWLDVNVLLRVSLDELCWDAVSSDAVCAAGFFHPRYGTSRFKNKDFIESWFLATKAGNPFFLRWRDLLRELLHNRLDVQGVASQHPLYHDLDLSGFERLNHEFEPPFDFREYLAIHAMCHRLLETDVELREQWRRSWCLLDAAATAFRIQLLAEEEGTNTALAFIGGEPRWDEASRDLPLVKFTTPHYRDLVRLPRNVLLDERGLLGRIFRASGVS